MLIQQNLGMILENEFLKTVVLKECQHLRELPLMTSNIKVGASEIVSKMGSYRDKVGK